MGAVVREWKSTERERHEKQLHNERKKNNLHYGGEVVYKKASSTL